MKRFISLVLAVCLSIGLTGCASELPSASELAGKDPEDFSVRGVDVSEYQGEIDWDTIAGQGIDFAFIKATEGIETVDSQFERNWYGAADAGLIFGAYHFFTYATPGADQADNFIQTVPVTTGMLPPVVDVELYGSFLEEPADADTVRASLTDYIDKVSHHYYMTPIIYTSEKAYELYIDGYFEDCPIWISDPTDHPKLSDGRSWTFWQYSFTGRLDGYNGEEEHIDLDVYAKDLDSLRNMCKF